MQDQFPLNEHINIFTVDKRLFTTIVLPRAVAAFYFGTEDATDIYEYFKEYVGQRLDEFETFAERWHDEQD